MSKQRVVLTMAGHQLEAYFNDNVTAQALIRQFPLSVPMLNLYGREMTYRFQAALPTRNLSTSGYQVGDIAYWAPRHSFVIFYKQTGEVISSLQLIGHIEGNLDFMVGAGVLDATFEDR